VAFMPPHPYGDEDPTEPGFDLGQALQEGKVWFGRLELLFRMDFVPKPGEDGSPGDIVPLDLAFITVFEDFGDTGSLTEQEGCKILYEATPVPYLYIVPACYILCRVPMVPCFLHGNTINTIPSTWTRKLNAKAGLRKDTEPDD
jgi:hypothetical protein